MAVKKNSEINMHRNPQVDYDVEFYSCCGYTGKFDKLHFLMFVVEWKQSKKKNSHDGNIYELGFLGLRSNKNL